MEGVARLGGVGGEAQGGRGGGGGGSRPPPSGVDDLPILGRKG